MAAAVPERRVPKDLTPDALLKARDEAERRKKAFNLRILNASYEDIAKQTGIHVKRVGREIRKALGEIDEIDLLDRRKLAAERLDALERPFWARALGGDVKAGNFILRCETQRAELFGYAAGKPDSPDGPRLGEIARGLPPGARATVELSSVWQSPDVIAAVQKARREKMISGPKESAIDASFMRGSDENAVDPDEQLYDEVLAEGVAQASESA